MFGYLTMSDSDNRTRNNCREVLISGGGLDSAVWGQRTVGMYSDMHSVCNKRPLFAESLQSTFALAGDRRTVRALLVL